MSILGYKRKTGSKVWEEIPHLELEDLVKRTHPKENGEDDGIKNSPDAETTELSLTEKAILHEVEKYRKDVYDFGNKESLDISLKISTLSIENIKDDFSDIKVMPTREFNNYKVEVEPELIRLRVQEREALRNLKYFKAKNNIERCAVYPLSIIKHVAILFIFLFAESVANMYFFAAASDLGFLGGFFQATLVSLVNVALSYVVGMLGFIQLKHVDKVRKIIGGITTFIYLTVIGVFHLLVAHYRDLLSTNPDNAVIMAWSKFRESVFGLDTFESFMVLLIGVVIAILSSNKGYGHDDVYPGYGKVDRVHKKKETEYNDKEAEIRKKLTALIRDAEEKLKNRLTDYENRVQQITDSFNVGRSIVDHFDNVKEHINEVVKTAISIYREANKKVRTDAAPSYFDDMPVASENLKINKDLFRIKEHQETMNRSEDALNQMRNNADKTLVQLSEETEKINKKISNISAIVDKKASEKIQRDEAI